MRAKSKPEVTPDPAMLERPALRIRDQLEQAILLGELSADSRLDESRLASRYGVSRTPVREALQLLIESGIVEHRPNRGSFVRTLSVTELLDRFEVMAELEALCGRLVVHRASADDIKALERIVDDCESALKAGDHDHYYRENGRLHAALYKLSGNAFLEEQAATLHRRLQPYRRLQLRVPYRMKQSMAEHRKIVVAIADGDADRAASLLREHVAIQPEKFHDLVATLT